MYCRSHPTTPPSPKKKKKNILGIQTCSHLLPLLRGRQSQRSHYLYENLPVKSKMAFLSWILILLAILLYEQYIHHTQASICPNIQFTSKWHAEKILDKKYTFNINYCFLTTIYEMDIRTHSVVISHRG